MDDATRTELEAAAFRALRDHLRARTDVQNIDLMNLAGFCRNCLSRWYQEAADARGVALSKDEAREAVYGMPYGEWVERHQREASPKPTAFTAGRPRRLPYGAGLIRQLQKQSRPEPRKRTNRRRRRRFGPSDAIAGANSLNRAVWHSQQCMARIGIRRRCRSATRCRARARPSRSPPPRAPGRARPSAGPAQVRPCAPPWAAPEPQPAAAPRPGRAPTREGRPARRRRRAQAARRRLWRVPPAAQLRVGREAARPPPPQGSRQQLRRARRPQHVPPGAGRRRGLISAGLGPADTGSAAPRTPGRCFGRGPPGAASAATEDFTAITSGRRIGVVNVASLIKAGPVASSATRISGSCSFAGPSSMPGSRERSGKLRVA